MVKSYAVKKIHLKYFSDSIKGKKYLFVIGEYISVLQSHNNPDSNFRIRKITASIPLWGIQLNVPYPVTKFKGQYEKLGAKFVEIDPRSDEVSRQKWNENDSYWLKPSSLIIQLTDLLQRSIKT